MTRNCKILFATALVATMFVGTTAISQLADARSFPTERTHATTEMIAAHPDLF